jgi:serine/threonine protein phosphatase PrpC
MPSLCITVSDGHGGEAYPCSDRGSSLAACAAEHIASRFMLDASGNAGSRKRQFEHCVREHLKDTWIDLVLRSWPKREFTSDIVRMHGATLLMALVCRDYIYIAQLGDGDILVVDLCGRVSFLTEPEEGPISNQVVSLCGKRSEKKWKFGCVSVRRTRFLMMSSDGLINSLSSTQEYLRLATVLEDRLQQLPPSQMKQALPGWLHEISSRGSGDDVSLIALTIKSNKTRTGE